MEERLGFVACFERSGDESRRGVMAVAAELLAELVLEWIDRSTAERLRDGDVGALC